MESQQSPHNFGRLATLSFLIGVLLCAVLVAQGLNEHNLLGRAPAALGVLFGGFLIAGILRAVGSALAEVDEHVARIEDATHTYSKAAADLAARIEDAAHGNGSATPLAATPNGGNGADRTIAAPPSPSFDARSSPAQGLAAAPSDVPAPVDPATLRIVPTEPAPPPETAIAAGMVMPPDDTTASESAAPAEATGDVEVVVPPIAFVEPTNPIPEFAVVDPDDEFAGVQERVQGMLSADAWAEAAAEAEAFAVRFPDHAAGRQLVARVVRQRELAMEQATARQAAQPVVTARPDEPPAGGDHPGRSGTGDARTRDSETPTSSLDPEQEAAFQHTLDRVQAAVDQRHWRDALVGAEQIVQFFPGHPRAAAIRDQLDTIRDNAEIQDRREKEGQIETLIRDRRYGDAMAVASDVIQRYPNSPQARSLDEMLPRLQDLAARFGGG